MSKRVVFTAVEEPDVIFQKVSRAYTQREEAEDILNLLHLFMATRIYSDAIARKAASESRSTFKSILNFAINTPKPFLIKKLLNEFKELDQDSKDELAAAISTYISSMTGHQTLDALVNAKASLDSTRIFSNNYIDQVAKTELKRILALVQKGESVDKILEDLNFRLEAFKDENFGTVKVKALFISFGILSAIGSAYVFMDQVEFKGKNTIAGALAAVGLALIGVGKALK